MDSNNINIDLNIDINLFLTNQINKFHNSLSRNNISNSEIQLNNLLELIILYYKNNEISKEKYIEWLSILYRIIGYTRDIIDGKGEYSITYMMIYVWFYYFPELAKYALLLCVTSPNISNTNTNTNSNNHPYGSWKDIKYFCQYCKEKNNNHLHPLINYAIEITHFQLIKDLCINPFESTSLSLVSKWIPREKSKYGWLFKEFAINFFSYYFNTNTNTDSISDKDNNKKKAYLKAYTNYRKLISFLNSKLDTVQIKQCANNWQAIDPFKQTSITLNNQINAFLNTNTNTNTNTNKDNNVDRIFCSMIFKNSILSQKEKEKENKFKGERLYLSQFTKNALEIINKYKDNTNYSDNDESILLNHQWNNYVNQIEPFNKMIPILDTSDCLYGESLFNAISLAILISQKSTFNQRILLTDNTCSWINLSNCKNFTEMVDFIYKKKEGLNSNLNKPIDLILESIVQENMEENDIKNLTLTILTSEQKDEKFNDIYNEIKKKFIISGLIHKNKPFYPPHIIFWNTSSSMNNFISSDFCIYSGSNPKLLNLTYNNNNIYNQSKLNVNIKSITKTNPTTNTNTNTNNNTNTNTNNNNLTFLNKILSNKRYNPLEKKLHSELN